MALTKFAVSERNTRHAENQNIESRANKCALNKVPHLKSSPDGRGEERRAELCKGPRWGLLAITKPEPASLTRSCPEASSQFHPLALLATSG